jgi:hypothetical protein
VQCPQPLGTLDDCFTWDPQRIEMLAQAGYRDTQSALAAQPAMCSRPAGSALPSASSLTASSRQAASTGKTAGSRLKP